MSYQELFVGSTAILGALIASAVALGPWSAPYRLHSVSAIQRRYGKPAARGLWFAVAVALLSAGIAIIGGFRPSYAAPDPQTSLDRPR